MGGYFAGLLEGAPDLQGAAVLALRLCATAVPGHPSADGWAGCPWHQYGHAMARRPKALGHSVACPHRPNAVRPYTAPAESSHTRTRSAMAPWLL